MTTTFDIPIYSRGVHPNAGTAHFIGKTREPVSMGDVVVRHGDVCIGDADGVVVASMDELDEWLPRAEAIVKAESEILARIRNGESLINMSTFHEHVAALKAGKESALALG